MIDKTHLFIDKRRSYAADPDVVWEAGQIAVLTTDANGNVIVTLATGGSAENFLGMFWGDKTGQLTKVEIERVAFVDANGDPTTTVQLRNTSVVPAQARVNLVDGTPVAAGGNWSLSVGGLLTSLNPGGVIPVGGTVVITYRYNLLARDLQFFGVGYDRVPDDTLGNGLATVLQGNTQVRIDQFDAAVAYAVNDALYVNAAGRLTNTDTGSKIFGMVIVPPTEAVKFLELVFPHPALV